MMTDRELMQQAVEAMEYADACLKKQLTAKSKHEYAQDLLMTVGTALRERLAQPEQEPVACVQDLGEVKRKHLVYEKGMDWKDPLYTAPPQRKPLTPDQVFAIADQHPVEGFDPEIMAFARAIEAAHGIGEKK